MHRIGERERAVECARRSPLHPKLLAYFDTFPTQLGDMPSLILSGPPGAGKRTLALIAVAGFSPSGLRYEKKLSVMPEGRVSYDPPSIPISDVHFEVDMALPCCGGRGTWPAVHKAITAAVEIRKDKKAIVLCKGFHQADVELLKVFSTFMSMRTDRADLRYIILTEHLSAVPADVQDRCRRVAVAGPECALSRRLRGPTGTMPHRIELVTAGAAMAAAERGTADGLQKLRDAIYAGLTRNMEVGEWVWQLLLSWSAGRAEPLSPSALDRGLAAVQTFYEHHVRSYRPVFHLERLALSLALIDDEG